MYFPKFPGFSQVSTKETQRYLAFYIAMFLVMWAAACSDSSESESVGGGSQIDSSMAVSSDAAPAVDLSKAKVAGGISYDSSTPFPLFPNDDGSLNSPPDSSTIEETDAQTNIEPQASLPCDNPFTVELRSSDWLNSGSSRQGCKTTVEGVEVKFFPLARGKQASHLAVYFHGDKAREYLSNYAFSSKKLMDWAEQHDVLVTGLLAVNNPPAYGTDTINPIYGKAVGRLLEAFNVIHRDSTLYWGVSGGPWYLSGAYIALYGHLYPGVFALHSGGYPSTYSNYHPEFAGVKPAWDFSNDSLRNKISLFYNFGTKDFLLSQIEKSIDYYLLKKHFKVASRKLNGIGHGVPELDIDDTTVECWDTFLNGGEVPRTEIDAHAPGSWTCKL